MTPEVHKELHKPTKNNYVIQMLNAQTHVVSALGSFLPDSAPPGDGILWKRMNGFEIRQSLIKLNTLESVAPNDTGYNFFKLKTASFLKKVLNPNKKKKERTRP